MDKNSQYRPPKKTKEEIPEQPPGTGGSLKDVVRNVWDFGEAGLSGFYSGLRGRDIPPEEWRQRKKLRRPLSWWDKYILRRKPF